MEAIPRRASWAARIVPEKPPPMIATGARRSDFIIRPALRISRARLALLDMVVDAGDRAPGGLGEPAGDRGMNEGGKPGADQLAADPDRANAVACPTHAQRARVLDEQPLDDPPPLRLLLVRRHGPSLANIW